MASLTEREKDRIMRDLLAKLKDEKLEKHDGERLKKMLEERKEQALSIGDLVMVMGFAFALAGLIGYLAEQK
jgi:hypothetical protein